MDTVIIIIRIWNIIMSTVAVATAVAMISMDSMVFVRRRFRDPSSMVSTDICMMMIHIITD